MSLPPLVAFDIDGTLTESKQLLTPPVARVLEELLSRTSVAIVSGGKLDQFIKQIIVHLSSATDLSRLYLLPTSGGALYVWNEGFWKPVYEELLSDEETAHIRRILSEALTETGLVDLEVAPLGERIENRGPQVTLSVLGQTAPVELKRAWDPDTSKREILRAYVSQRLPEFDVKQGGATSIDVTKHGINKAYGIRKLSEYLSIPVSDMLYVGDALFPGGNDEVVKQTGIQTKQVADPAETIEVIRGLLT